jgi:aspartyl protease family protein
LLRYAIIAVAIAALAVAAPRYLPDLVSAMFDRGAGIGAAPAETAPPVRIDRIEPLRPPIGRQATIAADAGGHFVVDAEINGLTVKAMIDTGATTVALTAATARRLGIVPGGGDYTADVSTANGVVAAAPVALREVRLGAITVRDVRALIIPDNALPANLLGMTFLSRLARFESSGGEFLLVE